MSVVNGWKIRRVRYEDIHSVTTSDLGRLVDGLQIQPGEVVADLMGGYGAVSREVLNRHPGAKVVLLDAYPEQLDRPYGFLENMGEVKRVIADVRECPLPNLSVDKAVIKMGVQEVPKEDQQKIVDQVYRILRVGGIFSMWHAMSPTEEEQKLFQDVIRKKDALAGFESFVSNRYLFRLDEAKTYFHTAGFRDVEHVCTMEYFLSTEKRVDTEFGGDRVKLEEWNEYIRDKMKGVSGDLREKIKYEDKGVTIEMRFDKGIMRGVKKR